MSKLRDPYLVANKILPYTNKESMLNLKQATHINSNTILSEIKQLDPRFNLMQLYADTLKYNGLKDSLAGKLREYIQLIEISSSSDNIYVELDSHNRSEKAFSDVKDILSMFTPISQTQYALKYPYTSEWDQIYNDIRWLDLYEARYHMDKPLKSNGSLSVKIYDLD